MSSRSMPSRIIVAAAALALGVASLSTEALAFRGGARGAGHYAYHGHSGYHGGYAYRRGYVRPGAAVGAAAAGAAVGAAAAGSYYNSAECGYYPNPPCY